jgi:hypothetical protein
LKNTDLSSDSRSEQILRISSYLIIFLGVTVRLTTYFYNRPFFGDEAFLASSVVQRNYYGLFHTLDYFQGAPAGYLFMVKTLIYIFGSSEYVLRFPSLASGIISIYLFYLALKIIFQDPRPYVGTAFFSLTHFLIFHSTEFKPYMFDAFLTLVTLLIFHLAKSRTIPGWTAPLYCAIAIWFSFPVIFTIASLCLVWFFQTIGRNEKNMVPIIQIGLSSLFSFLIFYFSFYHNIDINQTTGCWAAQRITLFPHSSKDFFTLYQAACTYLSIFGRVSGFVVVVLTLAGLFSSLWVNSFTKIFFIETLIILVAASLGRYYVEIRLMLFFVPIHILFISMVASHLVGKYKKIGTGLLFVFILISVGSCRYFWLLDEYRNNDVVNPLIECLKKTEKPYPLYIYCYAIPLYEYKMNYVDGISCEKNGVIYGTPYADFPFLNKNFEDEIVEKNGVIYGTEYFTFTWSEPYEWDTVISPASLNLNLAAILRNKTTYLLIANSATENMETADPLLDALKEHGKIKQIIVTHDTSLLLFERNNRDIFVQPT